MNEPLVSIIIPCYNAQAYVGEAIESALAQTYSNVEVIVIDDGSTDGSLEVIRSFGDRVRWESGANRGGGAARNHGLALAQGLFIQFLDADDVLCLDKIARQVPLLLQAADQSVFGWYEHALPNEKELVAYAPPSGLLTDSVVLALQYIIQTEPPLHWAANVRGVGGFDEQLPCNQDYDFNLRLACAGVRFVYDGKKSSRNLRRSGSVSSNECQRHRHMPHILSNAYQILIERGTLTEVRRTTLAHRMALTVRALVGCDEISLALGLNCLAFEIHGSGGVSSAYDRKSRVVRLLLGPVWAERAITAYQRISGRKRLALAK